MTWLRRHRTAILIAYSVFALTVVLTLQILEATGGLR